MLFPGQGPQYPGMGKMFYDASEQVRKIYDSAGAILNYDVAHHSFYSSFTELTDTRYAQPAIVVAGYAAFTYFIEKFGHAVYPSFLAGHSMGELTALLCAGGLGFDEALQLAVKRGELMNRVSANRGGTMAAVKDLHWKETESICAAVSRPEAPVSIAAYNSDTQTVITGNTASVTRAGDLCIEKEGIFIPLHISVASHCPFMNDILDEFSAVVCSCNIRMPAIATYSSYSGRQYETVEQIKENIARQLIAPVQWNEILKDILRRDGGIFLEAGPGSGLGKFMTGEQGTVLPLEKLTFADMNNRLGQLIKQVITPVTKCLSLLVSIPNCNDDEGVYTAYFENSYRKILEIQHMVEEKERLPAISEIKNAIGFFVTACKAKCVSDDAWAVILNDFCQSFPSVREYFNLFHKEPVLLHEKAI